MPQLIFPKDASSIIVTAKIEAPKGIEYANLVFDTGASLVMLPWKLAQAIGLKIDPNNTIMTTTASSIETSPFTAIPAITVLGHTIKNVDCLIRDLPEGSGVDGLLGLSFLRHFNIYLNFQKGHLELKPF